jgi:hypothetical protein
MEQTEEKRTTKEKMDLWGRQTSADNGNNKLSYSGQRLEGMEKDCIGSQGPRWTVVLEVEVKAKLSIYRLGQVLWAPGRDSQGIYKVGTWRWQGYQPYAPAAFTSQKINLALISVRARFDPTTTVWLERSSPRNIPITSAGNWTRGLPTYGTVPQPNVPLHNPRGESELFPGELSDMGMKKANHLHPEPRMCGVIPPLHHMPSWYGI